MECAIFVVCRVRRATNRIGYATITALLIIFVLLNNDGAKLSLTFTRAIDYRIAHDHQRHAHTAYATLSISDSAQVVSVPK